MNFDLTKPITVNGETFDPTDFYQRKLSVIGVQPTNYESYVFVDVLALHKNTKTTQTGDKAGGSAQATYRYNDLADLPKFNEHQFPYMLDVVMTDIVDKKGNTVPLILFADSRKCGYGRLITYIPHASTDLQRPGGKLSKIAQRHRLQTTL